MMKSIRSGLGARVGVAALGVGILTVVGSGVAFAAPVGEDTIDVSVEIDPTDVPGALALTVAGEAAPLVEGAPVGTDRVFTGTLPTVTVTDTRDDADVPVDQRWYILGSISDFTGDAEQPDISAVDSFGWSPKLLTGDPGEIAEGQEIAPGEGFEIPEFLAEAWDSETAPDSVTANAELRLQTPATVAPGRYSATLTLSLFEDVP